MKPQRIFLIVPGIMFMLLGNASATTTSQILVMSNQLYKIAQDLTTGIFPTAILLIAIGYNSSLTFGQKRVQVVWNRIIFPDGSGIDLERMNGVDVSGYSGFHDKIDNHYLRIYGNAVLLSLMGAGYDILNQKASQTTDPRETVAASVGQKLADVSSQSLQKNLDVQPTLIIDPGYKFKIIVMKDMVLENIQNAQGTFAYTE